MTKRKTLRAVLLANKKEHHSRAPLITLLVAIVGLGFLFLSTAAVAGATYAFPVRNLPSADAIVDRPISLATKIYDRNGELLNEIFDPQQRG